ncbi:MAG: serine/threonine-protein phosphatase [Planctomycetota bacterium]|jgi:hypothetical protein|nr:serine/threonine-protein phosphatase [Planctomycetota bacterium]
MNDKDLRNGLEVILTAIGKQSCAPEDLFESIEPLCLGVGLKSAALYLDDEYPDRMRRVFGYGERPWFPEHVVRDGKKSLLDTLRSQLDDIPGLLSARLGRQAGETGVFAALPAGRSLDPGKFELLCGLLSLVAHVRRERSNFLRERQERGVFFAQSLTSRLLITQPPRIQGLRTDFRHIRSLEAGGDFFDLMPSRHGGLFGMMGCCNGMGLRTVLAVASIMREIHRSREFCPTLSEILLRVNDLLIRNRNRSHQASLCLFEIDAAGRELHLAKAGRLGIVLGGREGGIKNISASGGLFLGLMREPCLQDEVFPFRPGQGMICVTEGFYSARGDSPVKPQLRQLLQATEIALENRGGGDSLAKSVIDNLDLVADYSPKSMLALSVEFLEEDGVGTSPCRKRVKRLEKGKKHESDH